MYHNIDTYYVESRLSEMRKEAEQMRLVYKVLDAQKAERPSRSLLSLFKNVQLPRFEQPALPATDTQTLSRVS